MDANYSQEYIITIDSQEYITIENFVLSNRITIIWKDTIQLKTLIIDSSR